MVTILLHSSARSAIDITEWTRIETVRLSTGSSAIICEKQMDVGEYMLAEKKETGVGIRLLKKN